MSEKIPAYRVGDLRLFQGVRVKVAINGGIVHGLIMQVDHRSSTLVVDMGDRPEKRRFGLPRYIVASVPMVYAVFVGSNEVILQPSWPVSETTVDTPLGNKS